MIKHTLRPWISLILALMLSLSCALGETAETAETADPVLLATVNGEEITDQNPDLLELMEYYSSYYTSYGYDTNDPGLQAIFKATGLDWAIECALYNQKAEALGITGLTDEEIASLEAAGLEEWESAVASIQKDVAPVAADATEEEIAAARVSALAYIESNYGYTQESYVREYVDGYTQSEIRNKIAAAEIGEITVTEQEIIDAFNARVKEDQDTYEGNVFLYEYYTTYMGETSYYVPEGYRGITHILLDVDQDLMDTYTDLTARLEEQQQAAATDESAEAADESAEATEESAEAADESAEAADESAEAADESAEAAESAEETEEEIEVVTQEMVDEARQAILDSVQPTVDEIMNKFNAGTPFADLIAEYGTDPGMQSEPNKSQGYMVHQDSVLWDPAFISGAMTLEKVGDVSDPVLGSYGVHILYYLRDVPAGAVDMTEAIRDELEEELLSTKESDANTAMIDRWKAEADIQYTEAGNQLKAEAEAAMAAQEAEDEGAEEDEEPDEEDLSLLLGEEEDDGLEIEIDDADSTETETESAETETESAE